MVGRSSILIVDDHAMMREGLSAVLKQCCDFEVAGEACDGSEALAMHEQIRPDVVLMDIVMPGIDGLEATRRLREAHPDARVLILSKHNCRDYVLAAMKAGADGYVPKTAGAMDLMSGIRAVLKGGCYLHPQVAQAVLAMPLGANECADLYARLTPVDREILAMVARSRTCRDIAAVTGLSWSSVVRHRAKMIRELGRGSVSGLLKFAVQVGASDLNGGS